jgi:hypothetical protein
MITIETTGRFDIAHLSVCVDCIQLLANGEINDGEDTAERTGRGLARQWGDDVAHLFAGDAEFGYSTRACEGCGDADHGDRFAAVLLRPVQ